MRRTVGVGVVAFTLVALAGVAGAQTIERPGAGDRAGTSTGSGLLDRLVSGALGGPDTGPDAGPGGGAGDRAGGGADGAADVLAGTTAGGGVGGLAGTGGAGNPAGGAAAGLADGLVGDLGRIGRQRVGTIERITRLLGSEGAGARSTTLRYPGASYVKVHLDRVALGRGGSVTVSDPAGAEVYRYDERSLRSQHWAMSVTGDTAVVTVHRGSAVIDRVARGFTRKERGERDRAEREQRQRESTVRAAARARDERYERARAGAAAGRTQAGAAERRAVREESVCGGDDKADAVCYRSSDPVLYLRSKAVVRLLINGNELCTGWRIGPNNRLITNNHCFTESRAAYNTEVWFNYQCAVCGGYEVFRPTKVWGNQVLTTDRGLDLTLFTVAGFDQVEKFGFLELELTRPSAGEEVFIPQHPAGDPTMIAARSDRDRSGTCAVEDPAYDGFAPDSDVSYYCDTEGGSSGSPVLSRRTNRVVALHHFGGCPNSGVRADLIYQRIRSLL